jgi:hypothetical protein
MKINWTGGFLTICLILSCTSNLLARQGTIKTKDGLSYTGDIDESSLEDKVVITAHNVQTVLNRSDIDTITYVDSFDDEYKARIAKLDPKDISGRMDVAQWAFDNGQYLLARDACEQVLAIDPYNKQANDVEDTIRRQVSLERKKQQGAADGSDSGTSGGPAGPGAGGAAAADNTQTPAAQQPTPPVLPPTRYLSAADINVIRQKELGATDPNVRIRFDNDVRRRFAAATNQDVARFLNTESIDQAQTILNDGDPKFTKDVKILTDPASIFEYKQRIQPQILSGCASSGCHGGGGGGALLLYGNAAGSDPATYTNFYILQSFSKNVRDAGGFGGAGMVKRFLVDRSNPENSLLLQYALPATAAGMPHPATGDYTGIFRSKSDPRYLLVLKWIGQSLVKPTPDYGIHFMAPTPATRPSDGAASGDGANTGNAPNGTTPAAAAPAGSTPAGSTPAGSTPAGSAPAGSAPAGAAPKVGTGGSAPPRGTPGNTLPAGIGAGPTGAPRQ